MGMTSGKIRWGILGAAEIARKNWKAIGNTGNSTVAAVASRDLERCRRFIAECQAEAPMAALPEAINSYEALLDSPGIDAVYIPLPTGVRKKWVLRAAAAGKHILCEKPCAVSAADLHEMIEACRRRRVQFMDGVMFMHSRRLERMREALDDQANIGEIRRIASAFSFGAPPEFFRGNIRAQGGLEPHGCVGDLGWYCIRLSLWAMKWQMPREVIGRVLEATAGAAGSAPVPTEFSGELFFEGGVSASFYCSFLTELQQWGIISGRRGYLSIPDFVLPFDGAEMNFEVRRSVFHIKGCDFRMEPGGRAITVAETSHGHPDSQETNMFRNFGEQIVAGGWNERWPEQAWKTQLVMEACLESGRADGRPVRLP
jgi:predicted dehydrogenase